MKLWIDFHDNSRVEYYNVESAVQYSECSSVLFTLTNRTLLFYYPTEKLILVYNGREQYRYAAESLRYTDVKSVYIF